jgi:hypothetical protein
VRNVLADASVRVRVGDETFDATARVVEDAREDALARRLVLEKYSPRNSGLEEWGRTSLAVAVDLRR